MRANRSRRPLHCNPAFAICVALLGALSGCAIQTGSRIYPPEWPAVVESLSSDCSGISGSYDNNGNRNPLDAKEIPNPEVSLWGEFLQIANASDDEWETLELHPDRVEIQWSPERLEARAFKQLKQIGEISKPAKAMTCSGGSLTIRGKYESADGGALGATRDVMTLSLASDRSLVVHSVHITDAIQFLFFFHDRGDSWERYEGTIR